MTDHVLLVPEGIPFFTRAQALALGESDRSLRAALRAGTIVRLRHGTYAASGPHATLDEQARHLVLARAVVARQRGPVALAGPSAALFRGIDVYRHDPGLVHLTRLDNGSGRREAGVVHHVVGEAARLRVEVVGGVPVVSAADAVWQTALVSTLEGGVVTADSALHQCPDLVHPLRELVERTRAQPGSRVARLALRMADPRAESPGESLTRVACHRHGVPRPELQHEVFSTDGRLIGRTDFWWPFARHLGEFDGAIKYGKLLKQGETASDVVVGEKRREDDMRSTRHGMSRFTWAQVQPETAGRRMARLRQEIDESYRLYVTFR